MKRIAGALLLCLLLCLLAGCGSLYASGYYHETDYSFPEQPGQDPSPREKVTVRNASELRSELLNMVYDGRSEGVIAFDPGYEGDARADLEAACGTMHREDALWAYRVQTAHYELSHIVTQEEAAIHVDYSASALPVDQIRQLSYSSSVESVIRSALQSDSRRLVVLIGNSSYSADAMAGAVSSVYRSDPACAAVEPTADVYMYSGSERQRLYDIGLDYSLDDMELARRREALSEIDSEEMLGADRSDGMRALSLCRWLSENCSVDEQPGHSTPYDALFGRRADSEGLALAYVLLCRQQGIPCRIVYGQLQWAEHCWNIIELEGQNYHVDVAACASGGMQAGFLLNDESMWTRYRWDTSAYEICAGNLNYWVLTGLSPDPESTEAPEETEEPEESLPPEETGAPEETEEPVWPPPTDGDGG